LLFFFDLELEEEEEEDDDDEEEEELEEEEEEEVGAGELVVLRSTGLAVAVAVVAVEEGADELDDAVGCLLAAVDLLLFFLLSFLSVGSSDKAEMEEAERGLSFEMQNSKSSSSEFWRRNKRTATKKTGKSKSKGPKQARTRGIKQGGTLTRSCRSLTHLVH
jgi:hypothetical protein